jgi:hypothetical protein
MEATMKTLVTALVVVILQAGFLLSVALPPVPAAPLQAAASAATPHAAQVVASR